VNSDTEYRILPPGSEAACIATLYYRRMRHDLRFYVHERSENCSDGYAAYAGARVQLATLAHYGQRCEIANVDPNTPCTYEDLEKFSSALNINMEVYQHLHTFFDKVGSPQIIDDRPDVFLLYSPLKKHFDANYHKCFRDDTKLYLELNNEVVHYMPDYDLMEESTDISCDGFIALNSTEEEAIPLNKVWYFDFETTVVGTHKETLQLEELQFDDDFYHKLWAIDTHNYQPLPFQHPVLDTHNYDYQPVVNYVEI